MSALDPDALLAAFRRAEQVYPDDPAQAARLLEPVVRDAPEHTAALELRARALFASAQLQAAEVALLELVERRPEDPWARAALCRTYQRQGRLAEAEGQRRVAAALGLEL